MAGLSQEDRALVESSLGKSSRRGGTEYGCAHSAVAEARVYIVPATRRGEGRIKDEQVNHAYSGGRHCLAFIRFLFHLHTQIVFFRFLALHGLLGPGEGGCLPIRLIYCHASSTQYIHHMPWHWLWLRPACHAMLPAGSVLSQQAPWFLEFKHHVPCHALSFLPSVPTLGTHNGSNSAAQDFALTWSEP